ncbi:hypothetical protein P7K49_002515 [Saguinus oedipus]|uniref:Uncharacterized protein n=1 Tax=Saguinus oedipus TaxID=9490 RepID=A0ABQ9WHK7_SAGOE|nr:hypothetical protein P7K49_002515 [Saguinus oedipus]
MRLGLLEHIEKLLPGCCSHRCAPGERCLHSPAQVREAVVTQRSDDTEAVDLLKHTPTSHPDHPLLQDALTELPIQYQRGDHTPTAVHDSEEAGGECGRDGLGLPSLLSWGQAGHPQSEA